MKLDRRVHALEAQAAPSGNNHVILIGKGYSDEPEEVWSERTAKALAEYGPDRIGPDDRVIHVRFIAARGGPDDDSGVSPA